MKWTSIALLVVVTIGCSVVLGDLLRTKPNSRDDSRMKPHGNAEELAEVRRAIHGLGEQVRALSTLKQSQAIGTVPFNGRAEETLRRMSQRLDRFESTLAAMSREALKLHVPESGARDSISLDGTEFNEVVSAAELTENQEAIARAVTKAIGRVPNAESLVSVINTVHAFREELRGTLMDSSLRNSPESVREGVAKVLGRFIKEAEKYVSAGEARKLASVIPRLKD